MKCSICGKEISERQSHSGEPLVKGRVCTDCNWKVIRERLKRVKENEKPAKEEISVVGTDLPESSVDPMADFEKYAKQFEETFVLGKTPVRKEEPVNKTKISNGEITGEVNSLDKEEKVEQVKPIQSATEGLDKRGMGLLFKFCNEIGIKTLGDLKRFRDEHPDGRITTELLKYWTELGPEFSLPESEIAVTSDFDDIIDKYSKNKNKED